MSENLQVYRVYFTITQSGHVDVAAKSADAAEDYALRISPKLLADDCHAEYVSANSTQLIDAPASDARYTA